MYIKEGAFKNAIVRFDLYYDKKYPMAIPMILLREKWIHPLIDTENYLHIEPLLPDLEAIPMSTILEAIKRAFSDKTLKKLVPEQCINFAVKHQYNLPSPA